MKRLPRPAELGAPSAVRDALGRVCALVEGDGGGWKVDGRPLGAGAEPLAEALYTHWYIQPPAPSPARNEDPPLQRDSLLSAFRAAHAGAATASPGWTVRASNPHGVLAAAKEESSRVLRPGEYRMPLRPGAPPAPGEPVEPVARLDHLDAERSIWWAFTERAPEAPLGRIYLDPRPATAPRAIHELTAALQPATYRLKCSILAEACERVDAIVVYHERSAREELLDALLGRWPRLAPLLDPAVPPLTCPVRPGLAWADDVEERRSYGESRCGTLAAAIDREAEAWRRGDREQRFELLLEGMRSAGVDPERPWVASG